MLGLPVSANAGPLSHAGEAAVAGYAGQTMRPNSHVIPKYSCTAVDLAPHPTARGLHSTLRSPTAPPHGSSAAVRCRLWPRPVFPTLTPAFFLHLYASHTSLPAYGSSTPVCHCFTVPRMQWHLVTPLTTALTAHGPRVVILLLVASLVLERSPESPSEVNQKLGSGLSEAWVPAPEPTKRS